MRYPDTKIELAAGRRLVRDCLNSPYLNVEKSELVATNGCIIAVIPVELDGGDTSGPVPVDALKGARKRENIGSANECEIKCNGSAELLNGAAMPRGNMDLSYPEYDCVVVDKPQETADIALDARSLRDLVDALTDRKCGSGIVSLWLSKNPDGTIDASRPIRVEVSAHPERIGVIMPYRI